MQFMIDFVQDQSRKLSMRLCNRDWSEPRMIMHSVPLGLVKLLMKSRVASKVPEIYIISSIPYRNLHKNYTDPIAFTSELDLQRYKYVVNVVVGEQRGEGVR